MPAIPGLGGMSDASVVAVDVATDVARPTVRRRRCRVAVKRVAISSLPRSLAIVTTIHDIPEVARRRASGGLVRIPPGVDVPLTDRVRRLIDTAAFRRLAHISQLGLVSLVYPAANHSRQEHSLGVFLAAIEYLDRLAADERFAAAVSPHDAELFLAAALLHDIGHWPFGHPIEDLRLPQVSGHEQRRPRFDYRLAKWRRCLRDDWGLDPQEVAALVAGRVTTAERSDSCGACFPGRSTSTRSIT